MLLHNARARPFVTAIVAGPTPCARKCCAGGASTRQWVVDFATALRGTDDAGFRRMTDTQVLYANIISNVIALLVLFASWRWRNVGRSLFILMFLWAAQVNMRLAIWNPGAYLDYAQWAVTPYRHFILGTFAQHTTLIVGAIAVGQTAIAILVASRGRAVTLGLLGAITFLLAIAPLGRGSAFPFSLTASFAAAVLMSSRYPRTLMAEAVSRLRRRRTTEHARTE
jgi:hypothetical protein